jgi:long-chain acyl-CoA synthetase
MSAENEIVRFVKLTDSRIIFGVDLIAGKLEKVRKQCSGLEIITVSVGRSMPMLTKIGYTLTNKNKPPKTSAADWSEFISGAAGKSGTNHHGKADDTAAILYSGGTTGKPKGIMLTNMNFNALAIHSIDACGNLEPGMRMLSVMPVFHGFGLGVCIHTILILGGTAVIQPKFSTRDFHKLLFRYRPNIIAGVPAIYESMIVNKNFDGKKLDFLKCIISGGDSLAPSTKKKLNAMLAEHGCKARVREGYGLTECVTGSCLMPDGSDNLLSVGLPYADTFYEVIGSDGEVLPAGETGEIIIRGPSVMKGYYKEPEETANTLKKRSDGYIWLHTGDIGRFGDNGLLYFECRLKRMIITNGYNVYPGLLEDIIRSCPEVEDCAVIGIPDDMRGEIVRAYIVFNKDSKHDGSFDEALKHVKQELSLSVSRFAVPRSYVTLDSLPVTKLGKVDITALMNVK